VVSVGAVAVTRAAAVALAVWGGVLRWHPVFAVLLGAKFATTTLMLIAIRFDRGALLCAGIYLAMDALLMIGAIWATAYWLIRPATRARARSQAGTPAAHHRSRQAEPDRAGPPPPSAQPPR